MISDFAMRHSRVTVPWSVCQVRALRLNSRRYWHNFFAQDSSMSLPDRVKIWLTWVSHFLSRFCAKVTHPPLTWASEIDGKLRP